MVSFNESALGTLVLIASEGRECSEETQHTRFLVKAFTGGTVDGGSDQNVDLLPCWIRPKGRFKTFAHMR